MDISTLAFLYFLYNIAFDMGHLDELCLHFPILLLNWIGIDVFTLRQLNAWSGFYEALQR